tara:strand:+ start:403 stop:1488 length:1086 start_codon:yes stop_codon:yes gene_type:complete
MKKIKNIGVLTSGGDCGGLNAAIRSIFFRAKKKYRMEVYGIRNGTLGLIKRPTDVVKLSYKNFQGFLIKQGGTFLGTNSKGDPFKYKQGNKTIDATKNIIAAYKSLNLDGLIVIGGDGSMKILKNIADKGKLNIVGIPKTIDNDVGITEYSVGFHTAVDAATKALDSLQSTAASHGRAMILEVMGRDAGHIALNAGIAGGADIILIPELEYSINGIINKLNEIKKNKIGHSLIIVAEATKKENGKKVTNIYKNQKRLGGIGQYIAEEIMKKTEIECRVTSLGHIQRGATPVAIDRILASAFGVSAVDLLAKSKFNRLVAWHDRRVIDVPIEEGIKTYRKVSREDALLKTALSLGIYLGKYN